MKRQELCLPASYFTRSCPSASQRGATVHDCPRESRRCEVKKQSYKHSCKLTQQENARLNDLMNHLRSESECMDSQDLGLAQQLQTSKLELSRAQNEVSSFSKFGGAESTLPRLETQESFNIQWKNIFRKLVTIFGSRPRLTG